MSTGGQHTDAPVRPDAEGVIRWLVAHNSGLQMNNGKTLDFSLCRRRRWIGRDRTVGNHYLVEVRGNTIRAHLGQCDWPDGCRSVFVRHSLILELPLSEYQNFLTRFRQATPNLQWWD